MVRGWQQPIKGMPAGAIAISGEGSRRSTTLGDMRGEQAQQEPRKWLANAGGNWRDGIPHHPEDKRDTARKGSAR